jgi:hypothetical protein
MSIDCHSLMIAVRLPVDHKATKHNKRERIVSPWSDVIYLQYGNALKVIPVFFSSINDYGHKTFQINHVLRIGNRRHSYFPPQKRPDPYIILFFHHTSVLTDMLSVYILQS